MTTLPILVGDLTEINSTLASLGPLLSANPAMAASSATGAANGLSISLGSAAKRQADSGLLNLPGLGALSGITGPLAPLIQILGAVLDGVTALAGLKSLSHFIVRNRLVAYMYQQISPAPCPATRATSLRILSTESSVSLALFSLLVPFSRCSTSKFRTISQNRRRLVVSIGIGER